MRNCCDNCRKDVCTKKVPIFAVLNSCELIDVLEKIVHKEFEKNEIIFSEGGKAETLYFVNEGKIKLYKYTKDGKEQILHILSEGDFFGELNLLRESEYGFNAKAIENCKICTLGKDKFKDILLNKPEISIKILEVIVEIYYDCAGNKEKDYDMRVDMGFMKKETQAIENLINRVKELEELLDGK